MREPAQAKSLAGLTVSADEVEQASGGAKVGHASLMRPDRPLPTVPFVSLPLRRNPNVAAAIIAARVARGHCTSVRFLRARHKVKLHVLRIL